MRSRLAAAFIVAPGLAGASEIEMASRIDRVTVYPDGAVVTRLGKVDLMAGASQIVLRGLPASVDPGSIRVEASGDGRFAIGAVDVRNVPGDARPVVDATLDAKIRALEEEKATLATRIAAVKGQRATIERFARTGPERLGPDGKALPVADWPAVFDAIGTALVKVHGELTTLERRGAEIDREIAALEAVRPAAPRGAAPRRDVAIAVEAKAPVAAEVAVSYRVAGASWLPVYEARLSTGAEGSAPALVFTRRAELRQRSGEDWPDALIALSTTRASQGTTPPRLDPLRVGFREPPVVAQARERLTKAPRPPGAIPAPMAEMADSAAIAVPQRAEIQTASLEAGAYQASFTVPGRVSVPADGSSKAVILSQATKAPTLSAQAVPELEPRAYLQARFNHDADAPLLPGEVHLHRDGTYVGRGRLGLVAPGEAVELGFGADDRITVTRSPVRRSESEPGWLGSNRSDQREFRTVVKSLHTRPVSVTVSERIPFSETGAITVETLPQTTPPTQKQVGDQRGVSAWTFELAPGAEKEIRVAYRLTYPGDREIGFDRVPPQPQPR